MAGSTNRSALHRPAAGLCAVGIAAALALAGCSGDSSSDSVATSSRGEGVAAPAPANPGGAADQADAVEQGGAAPPQGKDSAAQAPDLSVGRRSIIYTGSITVRVKDVGIAAAQTTGIVAGVGGFIGGDKRSSSGNGPSDATLILRVPAEKFHAVVNQLAELGDEERRGIDTEDATDATIDLQARIATQQARVVSGRKLLAQAKSLEDLVMLEREVATRESDLASLQAKQRRLTDLTALSTITLVLLDPQSAAAPEDDDPAGFLAGLRNGWNGVLVSLGVLATILGWLLPWLLLLGLPAWAVVHLVRRRRRVRPAVATVPAVETK
ncbi:DUF4349 domain-containing protein [Actinoplanes sp. NPDC051346]|uniref:DUF4349 domain-containing protein n=1 Tax=Actinoplanes sp. NPDC051346 TaxID=3155048 RepID=UPI003432E9B6